MSDAGATMLSDWQSTRSAIDGLAGQLGQGVMGAAFLAGYREPAAKCASDIEECGRIPGRLAAAGMASGEIYDSADGATADGFHGAGGVTPRPPSP